MVQQQQLTFCIFLKDKSESEPDDTHDEYEDHAPPPPPPPRQSQNALRREISEALARLDLPTIDNLTTAQVIQAYRRKALEVHPDRNPNDRRATQMFQMLLNAKNLLLKHCTDASHEE